MDPSSLLSIPKTESKVEQNQVQNLAARLMGMSAKPPPAAARSVVTPASVPVSVPGPVPAPASLPSTVPASPLQSPLTLDHPNIPGQKISINPQVYNQLFENLVSNYPGRSRQELHLHLKMMIEKKVQLQLKTKDAQQQPGHQLLHQRPTTPQEACIRTRVIPSRTPTHITAASVLGKHPAPTQTPSSAPASKAQKTDSNSMPSIASKSSSSSSSSSSSTSAKGGADDEDSQSVIKGMKDVTKMVNIDLREESEAMMGINSQHYDYIYVPKFFADKNVMESKLKSIATKQNLSIDEESSALLCLAVQERLKDIIEQLGRVAQQRRDPKRGNFAITVTSKPKEKFEAIKAKDKEEYEKRGQKDEAEKEKANEQMAKQNEERDKMKAANQTAMASMGQRRSTRSASAKQQPNQQLGQQLISKLSPQTRARFVELQTRFQSGIPLTKEESFELLKLRKQLAGLAKAAQEQQLKKGVPLRGTDDTHSITIFDLLAYTEQDPQLRRISGTGAVTLNLRNYPKV